MRQNWQMWSSAIQPDIIDAIKKRAEDAATHYYTWDESSLSWVQHSEE